jgi:hypothetical protein
MSIGSLDSATSAVLETDFGYAPDYANVPKPVQLVKVGSKSLGNVLQEVVVNDTPDTVPTKKRRTGKGSNERDV